jgi:hypothetical protein
MFISQWLDTTSDVISSGSGSGKIQIFFGGVGYARLICGGGLA